MKKVFVSMMLAGALLTGGTAYAQTQTDGTTGATNKAQQECCTTDKDGKKAEKPKKGARGERGGRPGQIQRPAFNPFDGIQLTDDQQQRLQVLQQGLGPVVLDKEQQAKIPENKDLTPEQKKQLREEKKAAQLQQKKNYLNGVKETLTPEQYVIFLENVYLYSPQGNDKGAMFNQGRKTAHGDKGKGKGERKGRPEGKQKASENK